jgi:hypothetical protein
MAIAVTTIACLAMAGFFFWEKRGQFLCCYHEVEVRNRERSRFAPKARPAFSLMVKHGEGGSMFEDANARAANACSGIQPVPHCGSNPDEERMQFPYVGLSR